MTVNISKPSINIREKLAELNKPSGIAGEAVLRADSVQEIRNSIGAGRKNLIINGGFDVWQRGTTATTSGSNWGQYNAADRWASYYAGTVTSKQSATVNGSLVNTLRMVYGATNMFMYTKVEAGSHIVSGKPVSLSFYAKSVSSSRLRIRVRFYDSGTETNTVTHNVEQDTNNTLTPTWTKYSYTFTPVDTLVNATRDLVVILDNRSSGAAGDDFEFAQVQLELGSVATDFEHRSYGEELALCQRYYQLLGGAAYAPVGFGKIYALGNCAMGAVPFITEMRSPPSVAEKGNGLIVTDRVSYDDTVTSISASNVSKNCLWARFNTGIARSDRHPVFIACRNGTVGWLELDAEL